MRKLIQGIVEFRKNISGEYRELFAKLALGQKPDALFIACSDSRVVPNLFASTDPGDLFVIRNVGNLVPPDGEAEESSTQAALEFAVINLKVSNIIVCGHSHCGAIEALGKEMPECPHLEKWLKFGTKKRGQDLDIVSQENVLEQIGHILSYPFIQKEVEAGRLNLHGWWFDIAGADVYCFEPSRDRFVLIDDEEAALILKRLH